MKAPKYIKDLMAKYHAEPLGTKDSEMLEELIYLHSCSHFSMKSLDIDIDDNTGFARSMVGVERG